jgi:hypothetical protein
MAVDAFRVLTQVLNQQAKQKTHLLGVITDNWVSMSLQLQESFSEVLGLSCITKVLDQVSSPLAYTTSQ